MKRTLLTFFDRNAYPVLLLLFCVWIGVGVFPLTCYESDSMHMTAGCSVMYNEGITFPPAYSYFYDMQPLIVYTVVVLRHLLPWFTCEQIYCAFTALSAYMLIFGSLRFVYRLTGAHRLLILLTLFFLPESYACAMYPNSSAPAMAFFIWALCLMLDGRYVWAVLLMCVAPLYRIDIVIVYPVIFVLLLFRGVPAGRSLGISALAAVSVVAFVGTACWLLKADPVGNTLNSYSSFNAGMQYAGQVKFAVYTFYTIVSIVLLPAGVWLMCRERKFVLLAVCLLPVALQHFMFRNTGCAAKHWLYLLPFVAVMCVYGWTFFIGLSKRIPCVRYTIVILLAVYLFVAVRFTVPPALAAVSKSYVALDTQEGPFLPLLSETSTPFRFRIGIGAGQLVPTADECMVISGAAFYPFYIHSYKSHKENMRREAMDFANTLSDYDMVALEWGGKMYFQNLLLDDGWHLDRPDGGSSLYVFTKGDRTIRCFGIDKDIPKGDTDMLYACLQKFAGSRPVLIVPETESRAYMLGQLADQGKIIRRTERCWQLKPVPVSSAGSGR